MAYMQFFDSKYSLILIVVTVGVMGCKSSKQIQDAVENQMLQNEASTQVTPSPRVSSQSTSNPVIVTYTNKSSNVQISLNPDKDEFYLDLTGITPSNRDSVVVIDSVTTERRAKDIQSLLSSYRKAQDLFYLGQYQEALGEVDKTLAIQETADAYALKGTIFFMLENTTAARANWNRAVQLDPNIPVPSIPELETIINEIREGGN